MRNAARRGPGCRVPGQREARSRSKGGSMSARMERTLGMALAVLVTAEVVLGLAAEVWLAW